jgi:hypothetical protein
MYDREGLAKPSNLDHSKVTRYNFAFFQTNKNGDIWGTDDYADPIVLYGEINWNCPDNQAVIARGLNLVNRHIVRAIGMRLD